MIGPTTAVPLADLDPDQPPDATQLAAPLLLHVSVADVFDGTDLELAASTTETGSLTEIATLRVIDPPPPVHFSV